MLPAQKFGNTRRENFKWSHFGHIIYFPNILYQVAPVPRESDPPTSENQPREQSGFIQIESKSQVDSPDWVVGECLRSD